MAEQRRWVVGPSLRATARQTYTVASVAYQVILEPGIGQLREFDSPPGAYSYKFVGIFS